MAQKETIYTQRNRDFSPSEVPIEKLYFSMVEKSIFPNLRFSIYREPHPLKTPKTLMGNMVMKAIRTVYLNS